MTNLERRGYYGLGAFVLLLPFPDYHHAIIMEIGPFWMIWIVLGFMLLGKALL